MSKVSKEYATAIALLLGAVLKMFKVELDNNSLEGLVIGIMAIGLLVWRHRRGDITPLGFRK